MISTTHRRTSFSIVIPSIGRTDSLSRLLKSIWQEIPTNSGFEVIVVFDGCTPFLAGFEWPGLFAFKIDKGGAGAARNFGVSQSSSEWIYFIDDDCIMPIGWLNKIKNEIEHFGSSVDLIGGDVLAYEEKCYISKYLSATKHLSGPLYSNGKIVSIATANMLIRKHTFLEIGGFDTRLQAGSEDANLVQRLLTHGKIGFSYNFFVYHDHSISLKSFARKFYRYGYSNAQNCSLMRVNQNSNSEYCIDININLITALYLILARSASRISNNFRLLSTFQFPVNFLLSLIQEFFFQAGVIMFCKDHERNKA